MRRSIGVALLVASLGSGCTLSGTPQHVRLGVSPARVLLERPIAVTVSGLQAGEPVTIRASAVDDEGIAWRSSTTYIASSKGTVDSGQPAVAGSYTGVDPMGIFDRMKPVSGTPEFESFISPVGGYGVSLSVSVDGKAVAHAQVQRVDPEGTVVRVHRYRMGSARVYANLYMPARSTGHRPAVLLFDGSVGGLQEYFTADLLAAEGYPAMALAYFGAPGLPSALEKIPLEYFIKAIHVLRRAPGVDPHDVVVWGVSRGSEAALLLAADFPQLLHGVVAAVPSAVVNSGTPDVRQPAWTLGGKDVSRGVIPVERIRGLILLICGGQDTVWPSCAYSNAIVRRLSTHGKRNEVTELKFPTAGHGVGEIFPYVSGNTPTAEFGGTASGDVLGRNDAWQHILTWLHAMH